jgi:hypothetical protein
MSEDQNEAVEADFDAADAPNLVGIGVHAHLDFTASVPAHIIKGVMVRFREDLEAQVQVYNGTVTGALETTGVHLEDEEQGLVH